MARVFQNVEKVAAQEARPATREKAEELGNRAGMRLATHRHSGDAHIEVTHGKTDSFVSLVDPDGGALAIEYGRGSDAEHGATQGLYPLHYAIGANPDD